MNKFWKVLLASLLILVFVAPVLFLFIRSVSFGWRFPDVLPDAFSLRGWQAVWSDPQLIRALWTTIGIGTAVVVLNYLLALPAAYALSHHEPRGKAVIETVIMLPIFVPVLAVAMGLHLFMIRIGAADSWIGVVLIHMLPTLPYAVRILKSGFDRLQTDWMWQGRTLGMGPVRTFFGLMLPMMLPSLRSCGILVFVISLSQYVLTAIIGGGRVTTLPILYFPFFSSADEAVTASFTMLFALLPIVFLVLLETALYTYHKWSRTV
ncbi:ABC transporter permease [Alkalicoccus luteus]|uniref:ABC transporter permease subunit n=1 Tax=Alkalicoccus luteus TaxID=1237094 RepID=A0A969PR66_9BACI|nr:ABC transporter permease subunit [Alkalicoccus luteus]NJP37873.1 ABC transporter permease subunit [Alkalicoccus luteus]